MIIITGNQPMGSPTGELKKIWYVYIMEYFSSIRRNEIMSLAAKWMKLEE
jgi:hypothetical protein